MDPQLSNDEQKLRDKILQHAFPFDEKAWEAMQRLLDSDRRPAPPIPPPSEMETRPGPAGIRKWWPLLLLLLLVVCILTFWRRNRRENFSDQGATSYNAENKRTQSDSARMGDPLHTETHPAALVYQEPEHTTGKHEQTQRRHDLATGANKSPNGSADRTHARATETVQSTKGIPDPAPALDPLADVSRMPPGVAVPMHDSSSLLSQTGEPDSTRAWIISPLDTLPLVDIRLAVDTLLTDSIIRPAPLYTNPRPGWENAWIFGVNANAVDHDPLRISVLPHIGYLWRYRLAPRTAAQGEIVLKYATGYDWRAEFYDAVPGANAQLILENNNLLFIELPLTIQRQVSAGHTWMAGLKPALVFPMFPSGSNSSSNFGAPRRNYTMRDGVRYLDLGLVLGWEYRFGRRWALDVRYNQGLFDLTIDNFFRSTETHLNSDLQVSLRHFVFKKDKPEKK
ncbi:MAG: outer membrane beta-barrel protein [Saprospiraceae bacterium]|nr:outer membrane beta-barrel protein [Saprospiraceae bacterium]